MQIVKKSLLILSVLFAFPFALSAQQKDQVEQLTRITLAGSQIKMEVPEVFIYDNAQNAYIYSGAAASIAVREMAGTSFSNLQKSVSITTLEQQQMKVTESADLRTNAGDAAKLYTASVTVTSKDGSSVAFERLIFICGNDQKSALVTIQYPMITKKLLGDTLHACLLSIEL